MSDCSGIITQAFGEQSNLYTTVLGIKNANPEKITSSQLRKAYYKRALLYHPDKQTKTSNPDQLEKTKLKFQAVSLAYSILSDPDKKKEYDDSGELHDEDDISGSGTKAWAEFFRSTFGEVTKDGIDKFTLSYKCSEAEESDVLKYYKQFKGDLNKMLECVMCSEIPDQKRWVEDYILPAISEGNVEDYMEKVNKTMGKIEINKKVNSDIENEEGTTTESEKESTDEEDKKLKRKVKKLKHRSKVTAKKKKAASKNKAEPSEDLIAAIRNKSGSSFGNFLSGMEERYGAKTKEHDISDDEFEKIRAKLDSQRKKVKSKRK